ncbi:MAG: hypothetical protein ACD_5C00245G0001 [uncultured bacterium]|nr:MAG: hypothetical protein ACD_5C00245G0001 [uncultured bacterium]
MQNDERLRDRCSRLLIYNVEDLKEKSSQYYEKFGESKLREIIYNFYIKYTEEKKADESLNFEQFVLSEFRSVL